MDLSSWLFEVQLFQARLREMHVVGVLLISVLDLKGWFVIKEARIQISR